MPGRSHFNYLLRLLKIKFRTELVRVELAVVLGDKLRLDRVLRILEMKGRTACFIKEPLLVAKANTGKKKTTFYVLRIQKVLLFLTGIFLELEIVFYHRFLHLSLIKLTVRTQVFCR